MSSRMARVLSGSLAFLFCLLSACAGPRFQRIPLAIERAAGEPVVLDAELAITEREQARGFMERKEIPDGTGMLFANRSDRQMRFWMKNTPTALSIAFIDSDGVIREIRDMTPFSLETVSSERSVRHALEVPRGWFSRAGVAVGDRLSRESLDAVLKALDKPSD